MATATDVTELFTLDTVSATTPTNTPTDYQDVTPAA
jgi:hypothetical protein